MHEMVAPTRTLCLVQTYKGEGKHCVEVILEGKNLPRQAFTTTFDIQHLFQENEKARLYIKGYQHDEELRWYLEDYLQYPFEPAPLIAARIENSIDQIGNNLFRILFQANEAAQRLWIILQTDLKNTRVEIITDRREGEAIPWELLRNPETEIPLMLSTHTFVRVNSPVVSTLDSIPFSSPVRALLVICRPSKGDDVPFRSVARPLIASLRNRTDFQLDVLRPPTFEHLQQFLQEALARGQSYHIVHFDGHGVYEDVLAKEMKRPAKKRRGYLVFENSESNEELIHGTALGEVLMKAHVSVVVLNACRSAYAEAPTEPVKEVVTTRTSAFGSLAQEVLAAGVPGVVAMRYNIYVATAAQFVTNLYTALLHGLTLGEAVNLCRKDLADHPMRQIASTLRPLCDWMVPIVYEVAPIHLTVGEETTDIANDTDSGSMQDVDDLKLFMPQSLGFFGRDETLLALDRTFDHHSVILLRGYAGSGKTAAAVEFARWYKSTGGVKGPVLFTSFEQPKPLPRLLDQIGHVFGDVLERSGILWWGLNDTERCEVTISLLQRIPVLWIWDNVEEVAGFPSGTVSKLSQTEQRDLVNFLQSLQTTHARILLTSRRDERSWLGDLPQRISLPPMRMPEQIRLAHAIVEKHGQKWHDLADWKALLQFTQGNPLTIIVIVSQVLHNSLNGRQQIEAFIDELRYGEAEFDDDDDNQSRSHSLSVSLKYGFEHTFSSVERKQLALLHFFQRFIDVDVLRLMSIPESPWCIAEAKDISRESAILLLNRAAEVGLLETLRGGYYFMHPVLPWYFKRLFEQCYTQDADGNETSEVRVARAYASAIGEFGAFYSNAYFEKGDNTVIPKLSLEEDNLLYARRLALTNHWSRLIVATMSGLNILYNHMGRQLEWERLLLEILPQFVNLETGDPLPGHTTEDWSMVTEFYVKRLMETRQWKKAEFWQRKRLRVDWDLRHMDSLLTKQLDELSEEQCIDIRALAVSIEDLATILRDQQQPDCVEMYQNAISLYHFIGDRNGVAIAIFNFGHAYMQVPSIYALNEAEQCFHQSLRLRDEHDYLGQARCLGQLGNIELTRVKDFELTRVNDVGLKAHILDTNPPGEERKHFAEKALQYYQQSLIRLPATALDQLAVSHSGLASAYGMVGDYNQSLQHSLKSIHYDEVIGNLYRAAGTRLNVGAALLAQGRSTDALIYFREALRTFESYGETAMSEIARAHFLIRGAQAFEKIMQGEQG